MFTSLFFLHFLSPPFLFKTLYFVIFVFYNYLKWLFPLLNLYLICLFMVVNFWLGHFPYNYSRIFYLQRINFPILLILFILSPVTNSTYIILFNLIIFLFISIIFWLIIYCFLSPGWSIFHFKLIIVYIFKLFMKAYLFTLYFLHNDSIVSLSFIFAHQFSYSIVEIAIIVLQHLLGFSLP